MPNPWPIVLLGEIATPIERAAVPVPGTVYRQVGVKLWGQGAYEREALDGAETSYKTLSRVEAGDIIVNKIWARNGSVAVIPESLAGGYVSGEFPTFVPDAMRLDPRWFHWLTKTEGCWEQCDEKSRGTSGKNRIRPELFLEIKIPLAPLDEQRRIVARIEQLAAKIQEAQGLRQDTTDESETLWEGALASTFLEAAEHSPSTTFGEVCEVVRGGSPRPAGSPVYYDGPIPFLKVADLTRDEGKYLTTYTATIKEAGLRKTRYVERDTLMLTNSGATLGVPKIIKFPTALNDGIQAFLNLRKDICKEYLYYFFRSKTSFFREWVARGQGQPNLNTDMVRTMQFPIPDPVQQRRIVSRLDDLQAKLDVLKRLQAETAAELDALLPSILDRAFRGELVGAVREPPLQSETADTLKHRQAGSMA